MTGRTRLVASSLLALALLFAACGGGSSDKKSGGSGTHREGTKTGAVYAKPGPYVAGVTTLDLGDRKVEVWYPADRGAEAGARHDVYNLRDWLPVAIKDKIPVDTALFETDAYRDISASKKGPFPLVLFSHGFSSFRDQSSFLTSHLATWGFVVAAPDHLERGLTSQFGELPATKKSDVDVLRATVDLVRAESAKRDGPLAGRVKAGKIAITGHSAGGAASIQFGAQPDVVTYIPLSAGTDSGSESGQAPPPLPDTPSMHVEGAADTVVPLTAVQSTYDRAPKPKRLVVLGNEGHLGMTDICLVGKDKGGVIAIASSLGIQVPDNLKPLATDGCEPGKLPPRDGFPVIDHYVTAQLRSSFGIDKKPVGLDDATARSFTNVTVTYSHEP